MGPIAYALCQEPVIGLAMFVSSACAFPPLILHAPLSLSAAGASATQEFSVPVDKRYTFDINFEFPDIEAYRRDDVVGTRYDANCLLGERYDSIPEQRRRGLGRPIPLHVTVRRASDNTVVLDRTFISMCMFASGGIVPSKVRSIGQVELVRGKYIAEVTNVDGQAGLDGVRTSFSLVAGHGK